MKYTLIPAAFLAMTALGSAHASEDECNVPKSQWQPEQTLQQKLEAEGWQVKRIKVDDGCYEVYGVNAEGKRMETYFNPKTFEVVKSEQEG